VLLSLYCPTETVCPPLALVKTKKRTNVGVPTGNILSYKIFWWSASYCVCSMSCFVDSCMVVSLAQYLVTITYYIAAICYICVFYRHFFWVYLDYSSTCFGLSSFLFFLFLFRAFAKITGHVWFVGNKYFCSDLVSGKTLTTRRCMYEKGAKGEAECQAQSSTSWSNEIPLMQNMFRKSWI
jgi:hypothetical protein